MHTLKNDSMLAGMAPTAGEGRDVLVVNVAEGGHVYPTLPMTAELVRRGHRVRYATAGAFAEPVAATGAEVLPYESRVAQVDAAEVFGADDRSLPYVIYLEENLAVRRAVEDHYGDAAPDVILYGDFPFIAGQLLAHRWGIPAVRLSAAFAANDHYSFSDDMIAESGLTHPLELDTFRDRLAKLLAGAGVAATPHEFWNRIEDRTLVFIPRAFQIAADTFDERFTFVGPCLDVTPPPEAWQPPDDRPVVLVSLGTTFNDHPDFFADCARAFADTRWRVVMTVGDAVDPAELEPLPGNVEVHRWVSHLGVLEHAAVCVTHGGMGTVMAALYLGRPVVAVPHSFDVMPMARQVADLGLGQLLDHATTDGQSLAAVVEQVAADPAVTRRALAMRQHIHTAPGAAGAADAIEAHLARHPQAVAS